MEKRTILAVALSMAVMFGFFFAQEKFFPRPKPTTPPVSQGSETPERVSTAQEPTTSVPSTSMASSMFPQEGSEANAEDEIFELQTVMVETDLVKVTFTNAGGDIVSYQLKEHLDKGEPVEMILGGNAPTQAFALAFGSREDVAAKNILPENRNFRVKRVSDLIVEFSRDFTVSQDKRFTLVKRYEFRPGEYMFELTIAMDGGHSMNSFDFGGAAYTLMYGPQIGPRFVKLDQRAEFRQYLTYNKNKVKQEKINTQAKEVPAWTAIVGKYFALIAIPNSTQFDVFFSDQKEDGIPSASRMYITRPARNSSRIEDQYYFYLGPKKQDVLDTYYNGKNNFTPPLHGYQLSDAAKTRSFMSIPPLEKLLKAILMLCYKITPNYGVAIILLTLLVKIAIFPLTKKGSESTLRMQALAPKIKEIQTKYKDNPQKMNAEMAEFYKKEGYNPLSGCLPMLIQFPIFIGMYNLFNNHFDLRGAMFIPGWIPDLSLPEAIYNFPENFKLPLLGWTALRLLPFIYVGSQLLYGKVTQTPDQKGNSQMKIMLYAMPVIFFFILYDVPSGLLLYWIMSNVLTMVQQVTINKYMARKKAAMAAQNPAPVIAPGPKKKKRK